MVLVWWNLMLLTGMAGWIDGRHEIIPNGLSLVATVLGLWLMAMGVVPWSGLIWAIVIWVFYEIEQWLTPGRLGWGDVKWAAITMGYLGGPGILVIAAGHLGSALWGTGRWIRSERGTCWATVPGPWAPGAAVGLLLVGAFKIWTLGAFTDWRAFGSPGGLQLEAVLFGWALLVVFSALAGMAWLDSRHHANPEEVHHAAVG